MPDKKPTLNDALTGLQVAKDELWELERTLEQTGLATEETMQAVLNMDRILTKEEYKWREKQDNAR